jgi:hypothetical protein
VKTVLMLGKCGDLLNLAPVLKHFADNGGVRLVVSGAFSDTVEAMPYVQPHYVPFDHYRVDLALPYAKKLDPNVIVAQCYGKYCPKEHQRPGVPFNLAAWLACGFTEEDFADRKRFPLVLARNEIREKNLLERSGAVTSAPYVAVACTCGGSSPVPTGTSLYGTIRNALLQRNIPILNLCSYCAPSIADMLALLERARLLVLEDSAFLHLAAATDVPVIALQPDEAHRASRVRARLLKSFRYGELLTPTPLVNAMLGALGVPTDEFQGRDRHAAAETAVARGPGA